MSARRGLSLLLACALALVLSAPAAGRPSALRAAPFRVVLKAPKTNPRVNVRWYYAIVVSDLKGRPIRATVTAHILDPLGGVHPVDYGPTQKPIRNFPFKGTFRDWLTFPPESKGFQLTIRWTIKALGGKRVLTRTVVPQP
jgi:hypothetical protein